jgi:hypothetical protein
MSLGFRGLAMAKTVVRNAGASRRAWEWTRPRQEAMRLTLRGHTQSEIAGKLRCHRHTIANWSAAPEWIERLQAALLEKKVATKLRRVHATEAIADRLAERALQALDRPQLPVGEAQVVLREHREYMRIEREHFGEGLGHRESGGPAVQVVVESSVPAVSGTSFREWIESCAHVLDWGRVSACSSPSVALIELTTQALQESDLLDRFDEVERNGTQSPHAGDRIL